MDRPTAEKQIKVSELDITLRDKYDQRPKLHLDLPPGEEIPFGKIFSDHMLLCNWKQGEGWGRPRIVPFGDISISPSCIALHYGCELYEGMKAFYGVDGKIRLFRPMENMKRLNKTAARGCLPQIDGEQYLECIKKLIRIDKEWIPKKEKSSLYVRPHLFGTENYIGIRATTKALLCCFTSPAGPYFPRGFKPVSLYADPSYVRAWPGGSGDTKLGGNYAPTVQIQYQALDKGCDQVLWLLGEQHKITEVGTMNVFVHWINEDGELEIATPELDGTILSGITRMSVLDLAKNWGTHKVVERVITMNDIKKALDEKRMKEMFGTGTACVVTPINRILYVDEHLHIPVMNDGAATRLHDQLQDIQYGRTPHEWAVVID